MQRNFGGKFLQELIAIIDTILYHPEINMSKEMTGKAKLIQPSVFYQLRE